jgi:hypothetical protein
MSISEHTLIIALIVIAILVGLIWLWNNIPRRRG